MATTSLPAFTDSVRQEFFVSPLAGPVHPRNYLDLFPEEVYSLAPDTHLVRFMYALLGPAGVGWLGKNYLDARLILADHGLETFDIDRFYGDPFRFGRILSERYADDPTGLLPRADWDRIKALDEGYRTRAIDFFNGARAGNTPEGMRLAARSGVNHEVEIIENYQYLFDTHSDDPRGLTYFGTTMATEEFIVVPRHEVSRQEVQRITITGNPTGGNFHLVLNGAEATVDIPYNATAAPTFAGPTPSVQSALEALRGIGVGNVRVTGGPADTGAVSFIPYVVTFSGRLAGLDIRELTAISDLTGGTPAISIETVVSGNDSTDEIVNITPALQYNLQTALDFLRPVATLPTTNVGRGLRTQQRWNTSLASSEYNEVLRFVTGSRLVPWPTVDSTHWIERATEKQAPRVKDDRQQHYVSFHNINTVKAFRSEALVDVNYATDQGALSAYTSQHVGAFDSHHTIAFPFLGSVPSTTPATVFMADRVLADYPEPLAVTTQTGTPSTTGVSLINGIYPADYATLSGVPTVKYRDDQFWSSLERNSGGEILEIDLGTPQAVNFITMEITRKPFDIALSYDTLDLYPKRNFTAVTPTTLDFPQAVFYEGTINPWEPLEFHFTDASGQAPFTRFIRIVFTRRLTVGPTPGFLYSSSTATQYAFSVDVKNLRIGRNMV